jgi:hypothetical protein
MGVVAVEGAVGLRRKGALMRFGDAEVKNWGLIPIAGRTGLSTIDRGRAQDF